MARALSCQKWWEWVGGANFARGPPMGRMPEGRFSLGHMPARSRVRGHRVPAVLMQDGLW